ncbi:MAG: DUF1565 domain-containing protein [Bacteroidales bacterium]|nr:DUF1565 domain-containing protein [Bacteroidales bacterium]
MKTYYSIRKTVCKAIPAMLLGFALLFSTGQVASAQLLNDITRRAKNAAETKIKMGADRAVHNTLDKAGKAVEKGAKNAVDNAGAKSSKSGSSQVPEGRSKAVKAGNGSTWYVAASGSNKNDGKSPETPLKNVQKALDEASDGDVICVAEGNYTGTLDQGFIEIKKYVSLVGGYAEDFSERDPYVYKTYIQTNPSHVSKNGTKASINIEVTGSRNKVVMIDGFSVDRGEQALYCAPDPSDPVSGTPEGCLTGRKLMVGESPSTAKVGGAAQERQCVTGHVEGHLIIRNCVFANAVYFGIQLMSKGGNWEVYNNVFVANNYSSCRIDSMTAGANECYVDFHHNTVLFSWCRDKIMEDMGYGYEFMSRVDSDVHDNIFGCSNLGAISFAHHDSNKEIDAKRKLNVVDNQFFMNVADMIIPSQSFMWLYVKCDEFEDVEGINESGNVELTDEDFVMKINQPYLKGFANIEKVSSSSYNPNSAANQVRRAFGINQQGSEINRVSMFANKYPFFEAYNLFGALQGCGAQIL